VSARRTYRLIVTASIEVDDEELAEVQRLVQEQVNVMFYRMARENDIRVVLQHQCAVVETP
jgi:hypothetical protein